ncbi:hypothetical protein D3C80_888910 [compost metagenome]
MLLFNDVIGKIELLIDPQFTFKTFFGKPEIDLKRVGCIVGKLIVPIVVKYRCTASER